MELTVQGKAVQRLMELAPAETDGNLVASLRRLVGSSLECRERLSFPDGGGYVVGSVDVDVPPMSDDKRQKALSMIYMAMQPAPRSAIVERLAILRVKTASRNLSDTDAELTLEAYSRGPLAASPADIVIAVLDRRRQWFPTECELLAECDAMKMRRVALRNAISCAHRASPEAAKPLNVGLSPEELNARARQVAELMAKLNGGASETRRPAPARLTPDDELRELEMASTAPIRVSNSLINRINGSKE